jgi:hypothetical protein
MTDQTASTATVPPEETLPDLEVILPLPTECTVGGIPVTVRHLRAREFFMLMGVLTNGLGPAMGNMDFTGGDVEAKLLAALVMALPNSYDRFLYLCRDIVEPVDERRASELRGYMENPEVEDLLPIVDAVIANEHENIESLLGKARAYLARWKTTFAKSNGRSPGQ